MSEDLNGTLVVTIYNKPGDEGCAYTLRAPDGSERTIGDGEPVYWAIADAIDAAFEPTR